MTQHINYPAQAIAASDEALQSVSAQPPVLPPSATSEAISIETQPSSLLPVFTETQPLPTSPTPPSTSASAPIPPPVIDFDRMNSWQNHFPMGVHPQVWQQTSSITPTIDTASAAYLQNVEEMKEYMATKLEQIVIQELSKFRNPLRISPVLLARNIRMTFFAFLENDAQEE